MISHNNGDLQARTMHCIQVLSMLF